MPPKAPQNPRWLQKIGERVDEYGDVLQAHTQCPEGELAAPDTGYAATMRKEAFKRQLQAVQEGRRVPWMEWPQKPFGGDVCHATGLHEGSHFRIIAPRDDCVWSASGGSTCDLGGALVFRISTSCARNQPSL